MAYQLQLVLVGALDALHQRGERVTAAVRGVGFALHAGHFVLRIFNAALVEELVKLLAVFCDTQRPAAFRAKHGSAYLIVCEPVDYRLYLGGDSDNAVCAGVSLGAADEHRALYLLHRLPDVDARAVRLDVPGFERQQLLRAYTCEIQGHKRGVWTGAQAPSASV